jgi:hypothetical protein
MTGGRLKLPKPWYGPITALGSTSLAYIYAKFLKMYQILQQLKNKNKNMAFVLFVSVNNKQRVSYNTQQGKLLCFRFPLRQERMQLHHRLHGKVVKYLIRGTASHYCSNLQQYSGTDSVSRARLKSDGTR